MDRIQASDGGAGMWGSAMASSRQTEQLESTVTAMANVLEADDLAVLTDRYLHEVADQLPSFAQGVYIHDHLTEHPSLIKVKGLSSFYARQYELHGRRSDPVVQTAIATGKVIDSSLISQDQWASSDASGEVFKQHNMGHLLCAPFQVGGRFGGTLNLARYPDQPPFDAEDRTRMSVVASLFGAGVSSCQRLERTEQEGDLYRDALARCGIAAIVTDLTTAERRPNARARRLLDHLVDPWPRLQPALEPGHDDRDVTLTDTRGRPLAVRVTTIAHDRAPMRISLLRPARNGPIGVPEDIAAELTAREAEVAAAVAVGLRDAQVAELLHISVHTVKHHLKSVYLKLGVHTRVELANRLVD